MDYNYSTLAFVVLHYLPEFAQIHIHWVGDAIWPSYPLPPPSPFAFNLSQHWIFSNIIRHAITISRTHMGSSQLFNFYVSIIMNFPGLPPFPSLDHIFTSYFWNCPLQAVFTDLFHLFYSSDMYTFQSLGSESDNQSVPSLGRILLQPK